MLVKEQWKPIEGYFGKYLISNYGNTLRTYKNGKTKLMTPFPKHGKNRSRGYYVKLTDLSGKSKDIHVHTLVLNAFVRPALEGEVPWHKDYDASNNYIGNLKWLSKQKLGKLTGGMSGFNRSVCKIDKYGAVVKIYESARKAAKDNGFSYQTIMDRCNGKIKRPSAFLINGFEYAWDDNGVSMKSALDRIKNRKGGMVWEKKM